MRQTHFHAKISVQEDSMKELMSKLNWILIYSYGTSKLSSIVCGDEFKKNMMRTILHSFSIFQKEKTKFFQGVVILTKTQKDKEKNIINDNGWFAMRKRLTCRRMIRTRFHFSSLPSKTLNLQRDQRKWHFLHCKSIEKPSSPTRESFERVHK